MFFAGVAATLAVVLVVRGFFLLYKRRREASKLSAGATIDSVKMKIETSPEAWPNNQVRFSRNIVIQNKTSKVFIDTTGKRSRKLMTKFPKEEF